MDVLELLARIKYMGENDFLAAEYDKKSGKLVNSSAVVEVLKQVQSLLPEEKGPLEAANSMHELNEEQRDEAIDNAGNKVADLRQAFQRKMSTNRGAIGLIEQLVANLGNKNECNRIIEDMKELVQANADPDYVPGVENENL